MCDIQVPQCPSRRILLKYNIRYTHDNVDAANISACPERGVHHSNHEMHITH